VGPNTVARYRAYIRNDLSRSLRVDASDGADPRSRRPVDQGNAAADVSGKVAGAKAIANKHGVLAGALNVAVAAGRISANPCAGISLPRDDDPREMIFLNREQFAHLLSHVTAHWQPMMELLVASGAR
jgi:site-specific recombinase XerC